MRFPKKLSRERYSLLSEEDKKIYDYEHSGLMPITEQSVYEASELDEDNSANNLDESYIYEYFDSFFDEDKTLRKELGEDEYNELKENLLLYIKENTTKYSQLNEATADYWLDGLKLGWLGKLSAGLLTGLVGLIAWLIMKGKDKLAMIQLKKYMNKLVELTDSGVNKKRPWYSFLMGKKKNTGDYDKACFRTIQETAERNLACLYTQTIHSLGFFAPGRTSFSDITSRFVPENGSGLANFEDICYSLNSDSTSKYIEGSDDLLLPFNPNTEIFKNIECPSIPTNYNMLMSDIDYPTKAKKNPNGSLFMKPTKEILQAAGEDLGQTYFSNNVNLNSIVNIKNTANENYEILNTEFIMNKLYEAENNLLKLLYESDLDPTSVLGTEINQETAKRNETTVTYFTGNFIDAIDNYIRSSISVIVKLLRSISGEQADKESMKKLIDTITTLNNAAKGKMQDYMNKNDALLHDAQTQAMEKKIKNIENKNNIQTNIIFIQNFLNQKVGNIIFTKILGINNPKQQMEFISDLYKLPYEKNPNLDDFLKRNSNVSSFKEFKSKIGELGKTNNDIKDLLKNLQNNKSDSYNNFGFDDEDYEAIKYTYNNVLNEDVNPEQIIKTLTKDTQNTYEDVKNKLTEILSVMVETNPEDWFIIKNSRERMKRLKEKADNEITAKIDLICRTASTEHSSLGSKFKAALSKHPIRSESLKNIWARYSDDLEDRIESRIRSISGNNANSSILTTIKQFLNTTYPNLIAVLLYYKQIYYLIKLYTEKYPLSNTSNSELTQEQQNVNINNLKSYLLTLISAYNNQQQNNQQQQQNNNQQP